MTGSGLLQIGVYLLVLVALVKPLGAYMARVFEGERTFFTPVVGPVERLIYRLAGVDPSEETDWRRYALAVLAVNLVGLVVVFALQRLQAYLPLNPQDFPGVSPDSSFNTAVSFASNTNWQGYGGETTMSYLTQALGLGVQNFLSAATGIAVLVALARGLIRRESERIGNFWVDFTRTTLYVLLPLSTLLAIVLVSQGVVQSIAPYRTVPLLEPLTVETPAVDAQGEPVIGPDGAQVTETVHGDGTDRPARTRRQPDRDQAAGHERGRFLQRQLGASLREPDAAFQLPRGAGDPADPGRTLLHLRAHGPRHAPGLGPARGDARDLRAAADRRGHRRAGGQPGAHRAGRGSAGRRPARPAATWRARRSASASRTPRSGRRPPRPRRMARSTRCTTRSRRWADWCRCG